MVKDLYIYKVVAVSKVVDGDTIDVIVDLGFHIYHKLRIRLSDINTPEIHGPKAKTEYEAGMKAKKFVEEWIANSSELILQTFKDQQGKYGRYLGKLFNEKGECLNQVLLKEGLAEPYQA